jgi:two-component system, NarL family, response regulator DevR
VSAPDKAGGAMMRVLIVDDSPYFRSAARSLLERRGYEVVGEAGTAAAAIEQANELRPRAMLVDVFLPDGTGFGVVATLTERCPEMAALLTSVDDFEFCHGLAEGCGARGFVLKTQLARCDLSHFWPQP